MVTATTQLLLWRDKRRAAGPTADATTESLDNETLSKQASADLKKVNKDHEIEL